MSQSLNSDKILPFSYLVSSGAMAGNAAAQVTLTMAADSSFELMCILASATSDAESDIIPNGWSCQITEQSTGRQLSNARIPQRALAGYANYGSPGAVEKYPIRFPASCVMLFDFLDLSASTNTVSLVLKGYKVFQLA